MLCLLLIYDRRLSQLNRPSFGMNFDLPFMHRRFSQGAVSQSVLVIVYLFGLCQYRLCLLPYCLPPLSHKLTNSR